ncbi:hypothetical protein AYO52_13635 [Dietzia sp. 111N12-1]|nr:hypothetical protein AYO52_13635 [Dietzia sp. 111N12-1]
MKERGFDAFHQTTISRVEKGERPVRLGEAVAFADIFGRPLESMLAAPSGEVAPDSEIMAAFIRRTVNWQNDAIQAITKHMWCIANIREARKEFLELGGERAPDDELLALLKEYDGLFDRDNEFLVGQAEKLYEEVRELEYFTLVDKKLDELWPGSRAAARMRAERRRMRKRVEAEIEGPHDAEE